MNSPIKKILIVGGGTAGWICAGVLAAKHLRGSSEQELSICLIESPDVPTIGVGEGTWPSMKNTLHKIGISEKDFLKQCGASFKQASKFVGWGTGHKDDSYYHPFSQPPAYANSNLHLAWKRAETKSSFADAITPQVTVCDNNLAPKLHNSPEFSGVLNYGYHLDAAKFGDLLKMHCIEQLGVKFISDHVTDINLNSQGFIESVGTSESGKVTGDFFIDCSGDKRLLINSYKIPFESFSELSINDRAVAIQTPYCGAVENAVISSATISTAQESGWIWDIGLYDRCGTGYVYSSAHCTDENAEITLRKYIAEKFGEKDNRQLSAKLIRFHPGYLREMWHKNCVAVGMAAGFIEPLEASALALIEMSASTICDELPRDFSVIELVAKRYNQKFRYKWERVVEFLKLHYVLSGRRGSEYWRDVSRFETAPDNLREMLMLWESRSPYFRDFPQKEEVFPSASYQYVLYGMGYETNVGRDFRAIDNLEMATRHLNDTSQLKSRYTKSLFSNRDFLNNININ